MKSKSAIIHELLPDIQAQTTWTVLFHQAIAEKMGLKGTDHKCLDLIVKFGPVTISRLAALTGLSNGAITGVVDRLEKKGLARRTRSSEDRRIVTVNAVEKKMAEFSGFFKPVEQATIDLLSSFPAEDLLVLQRFIKKFIELAQSNIGQLQQKPE